MNSESILTGIVTGVLTGGITGYLAALHAMRQFKGQRAFDRQLDWYERTVRALSAVPYLRMSLAVAQHSEIHDDRTKVELQKALLDLRDSVLTKHPYMLSNHHMSSYKECALSPKVTQRNQHKHSKKRCRRLL